jgi:hypothetical protein
LTTVNRSASPPAVKYPFFTQPTRVSPTKITLSNPPSAISAPSSPSRVCPWKCTVSS